MKQKRTHFNCGPTQSHEGTKTGRALPRLHTGRSLIAHAVVVAAAVAVVVAVPAAAVVAVAVAVAKINFASSCLRAFALNQQRSCALNLKQKQWQYRHRD